MMVLHGNIEGIASVVNRSIFRGRGKEKDMVFVDFQNFIYFITITHGY